MMNEGGKYLTVDPGVELFVQDVGEGDPIIFIPGWTFTTEVYIHQLNHFKKSHRVIVIDPRSHGRSTLTVHGNEYVTHGTDLRKVIEALDLTNVTVVGWSNACLMIWEYVRQFGVKDLKSAVLVDLPPKLLSINEATDWVEGNLDEISTIYTTYLTDSEKHREFITAYIQDAMIAGELTDDELTWLVEQSLKTPYYIGANLLAAALFSDYRKEAKAISESIPTLTVIANHWADVAKPYTEKLSPKSHVEVLGEHLMFWEFPEEFNDILEKFLDD